jgi:putative transposase
MARPPRLILPGQAHHLLQRGNNRQPIFLDDTDRKAYLDALREASLLHGVRVHAYALRTDHVHLLLTPQASSSLARAMQTLGRRYVGAFNRRHGRTGTLWEGRYRTTVVEASGLFLEVMRYIEQHPFRGVTPAEPSDACPWTSALHHLGLRRDALISEHPAYWAQGNTPFEREARHRAELATPLPSALLERIRRHVHSGWPLVSTAAAEALAVELGRPMKPRPAGRRPISNVSVPN